MHGRIFFYSFFILLHFILPYSQYTKNQNAASTLTQSAGDKTQVGDIIFRTELFQNININCDKNVSLSYPQIRNLPEDLQFTINENIKKVALEPYYENYELSNSYEQTYFVIEYTVDYVSTDIFSVRFDGTLFTKGTAHGWNLMYTANINLNTGEIIYIDDIFNEKFPDTLRYETFKGYLDVDTSNADASAMEEIFRERKDSFIGSYNNFCFTKDKFIIILDIHSSCYRFAADYSDLSDCMKKGNGIWDSIASVSNLHSTNIVENETLNDNTSSNIISNSTFN